MAKTRSKAKAKSRPKQKPAAPASPPPLPEMPQVHHWTHDGERVLLVKCVGLGGKSHNGFLWPKSGAVRPETCAQDSECGTGGLFGWPWGVRLGDGKQIAGADAAEWIVFAAKPGQVFDCGNKAKVAAAKPEDVECEVVYYGTIQGALKFTEAGRSAFLAKWIEIVQARSSGSAAATGESGSAAATGESGSAAATGERGSAAITGEYGTIEVGPKSAGVATANQWQWLVRKGAVVLCRWKDGDNWPHKTLVADELGLKDGETVNVINGEIQKQTGT